MKGIIATLILLVLLPACLPVTPVSEPTATQTTYITTTSTITTPIIMCTPPLCAIGTNEVYFCPDECPGGCGTICATYTPTPMSGDLGWGEVSGRIVDSTNNQPIEGAWVACHHFSYNPRALCEGELQTSSDGTFNFTEVFFHDTDRIFLTVKATGYADKHFGQAFFTIPMLDADIALVPSITSEMPSP